MYVLLSLHFALVYVWVWLCSWIDWGALHVNNSPAFVWLSLLFAHWKDVVCSTIWYALIRVCIRLTAPFAMRNKPCKPVVQFAICKIILLWLAFSTRFVSLRKWEKNCRNREKHKTKRIVSRSLSMLTLKAAHTPTVYASLSIYLSFISIW